MLAVSMHAAESLGAITLGFATPEAGLMAGVVHAANLKDAAATRSMYIDGT
jgi:hypothetical protein